MNKGDKRIKGKDEESIERTEIWREGRKRVNMHPPFMQSELSPLSLKVYYGTSFSAEIYH